MSNDRKNRKRIDLHTHTSAGKGAIEVFYENYLDNLQRMHFLSKMAYRYRLIPSVASDRHREDQHFATAGGYYYYEKMLEVLIADSAKHSDNNDNFS